MSTAIIAPTRTAAVSFISDHADEADLDAITATIKARQKMLATRRASAVIVGQAVTLDGLSPKYLNGLAGTVKSIRGNYADVELDEASTGRLRFYGRRRFIIAEGATHYVMSGIPLSTCRS